MTPCSQLAAYVAAAPKTHLVTNAQTQQLRTQCQAGDVALIVEDFPGRNDLLRRLEAWRVGRIWLGAGPTPPVGLIETAWLNPPENAVDLIKAAAKDATPKALLEDPPENSCVTCRDEGVVGEVVEVTADGACLVRFGDITEPVDTALVGADSIKAGSLLLVHAGVAIANLEG